MIEGFRIVQLLSTVDGMSISGSFFFLSFPPLNEKAA